jgi:hypothetical protein
MLLKTRTALWTAVALSLAAGTSASQQATQAHSHQGFWIGLGFGRGVNLSERLDGKKLGGFAGFLRLGGTPSQKVLLGFEFAQWSGESNGTHLRGNASFVTQFYPSERGGAFLKGGVGYAGISYASTAGNTITTTSVNGFGLTLGAGLDGRLGRNLYLVPDLNLLLQFFKSKNDPVLGQIPRTNTILMFTVGLTGH